MSRPVALAQALSLVLTPALGCHRGSEKEIETSAPVPVEIQAARRGAVQATVSAIGQVKPAPGADWTIIAPQSARIAALPKAEGDTVRRGDLLARFEIPSLVAEESAKSAELTQAEARLENARKAEERISGLFTRGIAARKEVEEAEKELVDARAAVEQARSARSAAGAMAALTTVRARFDGVVARRWHNPGDMVEAASGDPVLRVVDPSRMEVEAQVPAPELPRVVVGHSAWVVVPGVSAEAQPIPARVAAQPGAVDPATSSAPVRLSLLTESPLSPGTSVQVEITAEKHEDALVVPEAALVREGDEVAVFVVGDDRRAHRRPVKLGLVGGGRAEVLAGLGVDEKVVVRGQQALPDGAPVTTGP